MADRTERVILTADTGQFNTAMARAAATAKGLDVALNDLDGTQVDTQSSTEGLGKETDGLGASQKRTTKSTKDFTLEMALAEERAGRLRKELREQARTQLDLAAGVDRSASSIKEFTLETALAEEKSARLRKELREQARTQLDLAAGIRQTNDEVRSAGPEIDRFSGRLRLITDAAITIGPALVPLGAAAIGGIVALAGQFNALAGGIGVTVLAMQGLGDAMEAVEKANLEPTAANLQAARIEMQKIGPAAASFVRYLESIGPQLTEIQMAARAGLFPGLEKGIDALLTRAPQAVEIVGGLADAMGDLARQTGQGLAGEGFDAFFSYLETDAAPTLRALGESLGNVAEGIANLFVGFAPVSRDFSAGLVSMTERFAEWSRGLESNAAFQDFVSYLRESGPQAIDLLGSLANAFAGIVEAAAPVGRAIMPILTAMADALAALARSDAGPTLFSLAAGMIAINRAAAGFSALSGIFSRTFASVEEGASRSERALSGLNRAALAVGAGIAIDSVLDAIGKAALDAAPEVERLTAALIDNDAAAFADEFGSVSDALNNLDPSGLDSIYKSISDFGDAAPGLDLVTNGLANMGGFSVDLARVGQAADQSAVDFKSLDDALTGLVSSAGPERAKAMFEAQAQASGITGDRLAALKQQLPGYTAALLASENAAKIAADSTRSFGASLRYGADGAQTFSSALSELNGWLDKRAAVRGYEDAIRDLGKGLRNGFQRADVENIDAAGRAISQVASQIKSPELRADFLAGARASLASLARDAGPKARAAVQELIAKLDQLGLTHPKPKIDVDGRPAAAQADRVRRDLAELNGTRANPKADLDDGAFTGKLRRSRADLSFFDRMVAVAEIDGDASGAVSAAQTARSAGQSIDGDTFTMYIDTVRRFFGKESAEGNFFPAMAAYANGGLDRANAHEPELYRGGVTRIWGEPETQGEAYIPLANDHRRPRAKSILEATAAEMNGSVQWFATGGMSASADYYSRTSPTARLAADADYAGRKMREFGSGVERGEKGLKAELKARQKLLEKALEREEKEASAAKERLEAIRQDAQSMRESVAARSRSDLFQQSSSNVTLDRPEGYDQWSIAQQQSYAMLEYSLNRSANPLDVLRGDIKAGKLEQQQIRDLDKILGNSALQYLIDSDNVGAAAGMSERELRQLNRLYNQRERVVGDLGNTAASAIYRKAEAEALKESREQTAELREVKQQLNRLNRRQEQLEKTIERAADKAAEKVKDGVNGAAGNGQRRRG